MNYVLGKHILNILNHDFSRENTNIETYRCIRVYVWFKGDKHVIWMSIWLIPKTISLLDRIWSLWLVRFAYLPTNFIFWLGRLIISVSINSHPENIYVSGWYGVWYENWHIYQTYTSNSINRHTNNVILKKFRHVTYK